LYQISALNKLYNKFYKKIADKIIVIQTYVFEFTKVNFSNMQLNSSFYAT